MKPAHVLLRLLNAWLTAVLIVGLPSHPLIAATYYVDPELGDDENDTTDAQSADTPWASLTRALGEEALVSGDVIRLAPGRYDSDLESFPLQLVDGVAIVGAGAEQTFVVADGQASVVAGSGDLGPDTWLGDLTLALFEEKAQGRASAVPGAAALDLDVKGGDIQLVVDGVHFDPSVNIAIKAVGNGNFAPTVRNSSFNADSAAFEVFASSGGGARFAPVIQNNTFTGYGRVIAVSHSNVSGDAEVDLELTDNDVFIDESDVLSVYGIGYGGDASFAALLQNNTIHASNQVLRVSFTSIEHSAESAVDVDVAFLGNTVDAGGNAITVSMSNVEGGTATGDVLLTGNTVRAGNTMLDLYASGMRSVDMDTDVTIVGNLVGAYNETARVTFNGFAHGSLDQHLTVQNNSCGPSGPSLTNSLSGFSDMQVTRQITLEDNLTVEDHNSSGEVGINLASYSTLDTHVVDGITIRGNSIGGGYRGAELVYQTMSSGSLDVDATFADNDVDTDESSGFELYMSNLAQVNSTSQLLVAGNSFAGYGQGVDIAATSFTGGDHTHTWTVLDNNVVGGGVGITAVTQHISEATFSGTTTISRNHVSEQEAGILVGQGHIDDGSTASFTTELMCNDVADTFAGIVYEQGYASVAGLSLDLLIAGNSIGTVFGDGINLSLYSLSSGSLDLAGDLVISNNTVTGAGESGIDVQLTSASGVETGDFSVRVAGNIVKDTRSGGIVVSQDWGGALPTNEVLMLGNTVSGADDGLVVDLAGLSGVSVAVTGIHDNVASYNRSSGLYVYSSALLDPNATVSGNTLTFNGNFGAYLSYTFVTTTSETSYGPTLGGKGSVGLNSLLGNGNLDVYAQGMSLTDNLISGENNYWGTSDPNEIINNFGGSTAPALAVGNILGSAPTVAAQVYMVTTVVTDLGLPSYSLGDRIKVEADLTGQGDIGCAAGTFHLPLPEGVELFDSTATTTKGVPFGVKGDEVVWGIEWLAAQETVSVAAELRIGAETNCGELVLQGYLRCHQLGDVLSDAYPDTGTAHDPNVLPLATSIYYVDEDGDNFGNPNLAVVTCFDEQPEGTAVASDDCNDSDEAVNFQATEVCDGIDNNCDGNIDEGLLNTYYVDADSDGFGSSAVIACTQPEGTATSAGDCDDQRDDVFPQAPEACDGVDNDCDEATDEDDRATYFLDSDGDGYGDATDTTSSCSLPEGYVLIAGDCDDGAAGVHPGVVDVCNDADDDCDGDTDEDGENVFYEDGDKDGFGDPESPTSSCEAPNGYVEDASDCDDSDRDINPDGDESCNGEDDDCDGETDEGLLDAFYADEDDDGFGDPAALILACDAPAGAVEDASDCDDTNDAVNPDATETCNTLDDDCDGDTDEDLEAWYYADTDGDTYGDAESSVWGCAPGAGYVEDSADCNDADAAINPAASEVCDEVDNNCNGYVDELDECNPSPTPGQIEGGGGCDTSGQNHGDPWWALLLFGFFMRPRRLARRLGLPAARRIGGWLAGGALKAVNAWIIAVLLTGFNTQSVLAATYYVDPVNGDDLRDVAEAADGDTPWASLSRALGEETLVPGDVIQVAPGLLTEESGETFPLPLVDGVAVVGAGADLTTVQRLLGGTVFEGRGNLGEGTWLGDMTIDTGFPSTNVPQRTSSNANFNPASVGVDFLLDDATQDPVIDGVRFNNSSGTGVAVRQHAGEGAFGGTLSNNTFTNFEWAIFASATSNVVSHAFAPTVENNTHTAAGAFLSMAMTSISGDLRVEPHLVDNNVQNGQATCINFFAGGIGGDLDAHITLSGNTLTCAGSGLYFSISSLSRSDATTDLSVHAHDNTIRTGDTGLQIEGYQLGETSGSLDVTVQGNTFSTSDEVLFVSFTGASSGTVDHHVDFSHNEVTTSGTSVEYWWYGYTEGPENVDLTSELLVSSNTIHSEYGGVLSASWYSVEGGSITQDIEVKDNDADAQYDESDAVFLGTYDLYGTRLDSSITIQGNTFTEYYNGIEVSFYSMSSASHTIDLDISDNVISGGSGIGIEAYKYYEIDSDLELDLTISGNTIFNMDDGIDISVTSFSGGSADSRVEITDNTLFDLDDFAIYTGFGYAYEGALVTHDLLVAGNTVSGVDDGIWTSDYRNYSSAFVSSRTRVLGNDVSHTVGHGIYHADDRNFDRFDTDVTIAGNVVSSTAQQGIFLDVEGSNNDFRAGPGGARVGDADQSYLVANNTVFAAESAGIEVSVHSISGLSSYDIGLAITGNTVFDSREAGLLLNLDLGGTTSALDVTIGGNTVTESESTGIAVNFSGGSSAAAANIDLVDNVVTLGAGDGIGINSTDQSAPVFLLSGNSVLGNAGGGIYVASSASGATDFVADLGGGALGSAGLNDIRANGISAVFLSGDGPEGGVINAKNNRWDADTEEDITKDILALGTFDTMNVGGFRTTSPEVAATATLEVTQQEEVEGAGRVTYVATLTGGGEIGCASAMLHIPLPEGVSYVEGSGAASRGVPLPVRDGVLSFGLQWLAAGETQTVSFSLDAVDAVACDGVALQGHLSCHQLGHVLTDDPSLAGEADATSATFDDISFYLDDDGDGYGDTNVSTTSCTLTGPEGYVKNGADCDDEDNAVNLDATEVCDGRDNNCDGAVDEELLTAYHADADGDGFGEAATTLACALTEGLVVDGTDCDDQRDDVFPGAAETCDGVDNDCDATTDEDGKTTFYADDDDDGYGDAEDTLDQCGAPPTGYTVNADDCDDSDDGINPAAEESCNGDDDDCDGETDESGDRYFHLDEDGDGFGDPGTAVQSCSAPADYVNNAEDCDDGDEDINPDADEECNGLDDDCNGETDEGLDTLYFDDEDGDGFGDPSTGEYACQQPSGTVTDATDCDDGAAGVKPGATETCNGIDDDCDRDIDDGVLVTFYADVDTDGFGDPRVQTRACTAPTGYAADNTDCNDADLAINPNATETCNEIDDDCTGIIDDSVDCQEATPTEGTDEPTGCDSSGRGAGDGTWAALLMLLGVALRRRRVSVA